GRAVYGMQSYGRCFFSSRRRHTRFSRDWSSDVCSSVLVGAGAGEGRDDAAGPLVAGGGELRGVPGAAVDAGVGGQRGGDGGADQIGRASCRERGGSAGGGGWAGESGRQLSPQLVGALRH